MRNGEYVSLIHDFFFLINQQHKHGWRYAKRPGVDKFLESLARHYEIVVFSTAMAGITDEVVEKLNSKVRILHGSLKRKNHNSNAVWHDRVTSCIVCIEMRHGL